MVGLTPDDRLLSYLPLSHIAERIVSHIGQIVSGGETWFARSLATVPEDLRACRPTIFFAVPRLAKIPRRDARPDRRQAAPGERADRALPDARSGRRSRLGGWAGADRRPGPPTSAPRSCDRGIAASQGRPRPGPHSGLVGGTDPPGPGAVVPCRWPADRRGVGPDRRLWAGHHQSTDGDPDRHRRQTPARARGDRRRRRRVAGSRRQRVRRVLRPPRRNRRTGGNRRMDVDRRPRRVRRRVRHDHGPQEGPHHQRRWQEHLAIGDREPTGDGTADRSSGRGRRRPQVPRGAADPRSRRGSRLGTSARDVCRHGPARRRPRSAGRRRCRRPARESRARPGRTDQAVATSAGTIHGRGWTADADHEGQASSRDRVQHRRGRRDVRRSTALTDRQSTPTPD